ncbi:MAG: M56 family metallopeptidase, partial [bacterium]
EIPGEAIPYRESTALLETAEPARIFPDDTTLAGVLPGDRSSIRSGFRSVNRNPRVSWTIWALIGWGPGALLVLLWRGMGWRNAVSLVRRARPLTAGCWRTTADGLLGGRRRYPRPRLLCSDDIEVPALFGFWRPVLLVPRHALDWSPLRIHATLLHELAHLKRGDTWNLLLVQIACLLHWLNPLAWILAQKLSVERERAADDYALNRGVKVSDYAEHLLAASRQAATRRAHPALNVLSMARGTDFKERVLSVLDPATTRRASLLHSGMVALLIVTTVVSLAALQPWEPTGRLLAQPASATADRVSSVNDDQQISGLLFAVIDMGQEIKDLGDRTADRITSPMARYVVDQYYEQRVDVAERRIESMALDMQDDETVTRAREMLDYICKFYLQIGLDSLDELEGSRGRPVLKQVLLDYCEEMKRWSEAELTRLERHRQSSDLVRARMQLFDRLHDFSHFGQEQIRNR